MAQYVWRRKLRKPRPPYYVYCHINRELFLFHTALLGKAPRGFVWDHINCDVLDNRRSNLRIATYTINAINKSVERQSVTGSRGVRFDKRSRIRQWIAGIGVQGQEIWLGSYARRGEAIVARQRGELKYYGDLCPLTDRECVDFGGLDY